MTIHTPPIPYVFISYASADRERVVTLVEALQRAGVAVWLDREGIHGGANYGREIAAAIKDSAALVLMTSPCPWPPATSSRRSRWPGSTSAPTSRCSSNRSPSPTM